MVELGAAAHAKPLHQAPARRIAGEGDRHHLCRLEPAEGTIERDSRRLFRIALAPGVLAQPPADLIFAGDRAVVAVGDLDAAKAEQLAIFLPLHHPEGEAALLLPAQDPV